MEENVLIVKPTKLCLIPHIISLIFIIGFFTIWRPLLMVLTSSIEINNKTIIGKTLKSNKGSFIKKILFGIFTCFSIEEMESPIKQVTSVKIRKSILGSILNYGTIYINTANGNYEFNYMPNPEQIKKAIMNQIN